MPKVANRAVALNGYNEDCQKLTGSWHSGLAATFKYSLRVVHVKHIAVIHTENKQRVTVVEEWVLSMHTWIKVLLALSDSSSLRSNCESSRIPNCIPIPTGEVQPHKELKMEHLQIRGEDLKTHSHSVLAGFSQRLFSPVQTHRPSRHWERTWMASHG